MKSLKARWTVKEEHRLLELVGKGLKYDQCSNILGRSAQSITNRMYIIRKRLELVNGEKKNTKKVKQVNKGIVLKTAKERRKAKLIAEYKHIGKMCAAIIVMNILAYTPFVLFYLYR